MDQINELVKLTNPETAKLFDITYTRNVIVKVPGHYSGLISDVPPKVAEIMISQGHRAFVKKTAAPEEN
jgi:hypothetical protein